jgi:tricorn protease-like protein/C-terminal processing protease CtpA/Prc
MTKRSSLHLIGLAALAAVTSSGRADVTPSAGMLRYPDVGREQIVFVYANDLWLVARDGGVATPLASPPGAELFPRFSPDDETVAFMGNYDGGRDLYTIPAAGGVPTRVTHHPAGEVLCDWTPDGERLVFYAGGIQGMPRAAQLFTVASGGGLPAMLPVPYGAAGAISPDGAWLAYTPYTRDTRTWKRYRGGMASDIWLLNLETNESRRITDWEGTDTLPMWHADHVYYLSDGGPAHKLNIWRYDVRSGERTQVTRFDEHDVKWPSIGPGPRGRGEIVFQNGSDLRLLDLSTGRHRAIEVRIPGARPSIRPRAVDASDHARWWNISSTGKRAVVEARGDVWTLPAEKGAPRNLTRTSGAAEREPAWSPDGRWIAYFSDATGEYELYVTQSDGKGETRQLTSGSATYYFDPAWSPDSKHIVFHDKAGHLHLTEVESGETTTIDRNHWGTHGRVSWSHDSRWMAFASSLEDFPSSVIFLYDTTDGAKHQVTNGMFADSSPAFDRTGDHLYFSSSRSFSPTYSDLDTTFVYRQSQVLMAAPLRADVDAPWTLESDEEEWKEEEEEEDEDEAEEEEDEGDADDDDAEEGDDDESDDDEADADGEPADDDGVSGTWEGSLTGDAFPPGLEFTMTLDLAEDGTVTGSITVPMGTGEVEGTLDVATGAFEGRIVTEEGAAVEFTGTIKDGSLEITGMFEGTVVELKGTRTVAAGAGGDDGEEDGDDEAAEVVEIEIDGLEHRAFQLPVTAGNFGALAVNDKNQLVYARFSTSGTPSIMLFDLDDEKKEEKSVAKGAGAYEISGDGKKILVIRGNTAAIQKAAAGATGKNAVTAGMSVTIDPRAEWRQMFLEAWRLQRDYLYVENMHGVDWPAVRDRYLKMLDDCVTREDVSFVIREMISELNVGHAYYFGGDVEDQPSVAVGLLGVDWELVDGTYRIARIVEGAAWDADARNPLRAAGVELDEGDYVLAVNGVPVDASLDPWAAFIGTAGRTITLTVSDQPEMGDTAREVVVKPVGSESSLRYRAWIERNRAFVDEQTDGAVGYLYVPNTGINGQNDLVRQFWGQAHKKALIIDERWNGGGQIPTRFIELLNRPVTNYWARRDAKDFKWPPDAHHGPKCMLINGRAGSGGDMFPFLFRQAGLGKLIGTRTWGGLVGISGNPGLIDGGGVTVPTFGFYEKDGTWGIEGHGVEPDIEVVDDPALMIDGGDPQLDRAIAVMLEEIRRNPYVPPTRPHDPDRAGMGVTEEDR